MSGRPPYLLDTNVISEFRKRLPDARVLAFFSAADHSSLYLSVLTLGELRKGVVQKARSDPANARVLGAWVEGIEFSFSDRVVGIDAPTATLWGELSAQRPMPTINTLLAATAIVRGLTLVTRNIADVQDTGVSLLDPWT